MLVLRVSTCLASSLPSGRLLCLLSSCWALPRPGSGLTLPQSFLSALPLRTKLYYHEDFALLCFETVSHYVPMVALELTEICELLPPRF